MLMACGMEGGSFVPLHAAALVCDAPRAPDEHTAPLPMPGLAIHVPHLSATITGNAGVEEGGCAHIC